MRIIFSCVCDTSPKFATRTRGFVKSLIKFGRIPPSDILVHLVEPPDFAFAEELLRYGVGIKEVARVSLLTPTLNKLAQLHTDEILNADVAILCDCDLAFAEDIRPCISSDCILGNSVTRPNPTLKTWVRLLEAAGMQTPPLVRCLVLEDQLTIHQNLNGGLLIIPRIIMSRLAESWLRWSKWVEVHTDLLDGKVIFSDQISFALACIDDEIPIRHFSAAYNYPAAYKGSLIGDQPPAVLHYHDAVDAAGRIEHSGHPIVDAVTDRVNAVMGDDDLSAELKSLSN